MSYITLQYNISKREEEEGRDAGEEKCGGSCEVEGAIRGNCPTRARMEKGHKTMMMMMMKYLINRFILIVHMKS